jgi:transcriptional regulator with XRE-family HTH domain
MKPTKRDRLVAAGWKLGDAGEFLGLSAEERAMVETRLALAAGVRERRRAERLNQTELARRLGSSQSRVAKMEAADPSVSIDLMVRALYGLGASNRDVALLIRNGAPRITAHPQRSESRHDPTAEKALALAARTAKQYRNALRQLAR